jgi:hypothetical protein
MSDAPNRLAGTAYLSLDGVSVQLVGEFSWKPSTPTREALLGEDGFHGYSEKPAVGEIKAKLRDSGNVSVTQLGKAVDITVTVLLANGKTVVGRDMFVTEQPTVSTDDATIDMTWQGASVEEV